MAIKEPFTKPSQHEQDGEPDPDRSSRKRRALLVGGPLAALALAGGLYTALKPSHHEAGKVKAPQPNPTAEATNSATPSAAAPAVKPTASTPQAKALKPLCSSVPTEVFASVLSSSACSPTDRDNNTVMPFQSADSAHAEWGGPEGQADEVIVTIRPSFQNGYDQFAISKQVNASSNPQEITVNGNPAIYIPEQDFTTDSGYGIRAEIEIIKAGPYLVSLAAEQSTNESALSEQAVTHLAQGIVSHAIPAHS